MKKEDFYKHLIHNVSDAVYTVDISTFCFSSVNRAGEVLTGYKKSELIGMSVAAVVAPEYLPLVQKMVTKKERSPAATIYEVEVVRKDGRRIPVEISSRAMYSKGVPIEILGIARDISQRKQLERQRELFIGVITHEVKNPLTSVNMYLELLHKAVEKKNLDKAPVYVQAIKNQIDRMTTLMNDYLEVTQLQTGKFSIRKEVVDLDQELKALLQTFPKTSQTPRIRMKGTIGQNVLVDKKRICQVVANLITNAIKYSTQSDEILVEAKKSKTDIVIAVTDMGEGISLEEQKDLFEPFFRTKSGKKKASGHGLGLYICREIIRSHKGTIWVESEKEKGSTFAFSIPLG